MTLELLHHEYIESVPDGLKYTAFCERYREWLKRRGLVMRQVHVAGDKLFVDYSAKKPHIVDPSTGEVIEVELFVAVLGASNLTYAEVTWSQRGPDFIASHVRALEYLGGVPAALVPDQLKSGVTRACRYEPEAQRTYEELARPAKGCWGCCELPKTDLDGRPETQSPSDPGGTSVPILARAMNAPGAELRRMDYFVGVMHGDARPLASIRQRETL